MSEAGVVKPADIPGYSPLRAVCRAAFFAFCTLVMVGPFIVTAMIYLPWAKAIQDTWARLALRVLGFDLHVIGLPSHLQPTLFAANHVSYLDIPVFLCSIRATFVAKSEVGTWPLFGLTGRLTKTVFVKRDRAEARRQRDMLVRRLGDGENLLFFPEGTSTDGSDVLPFKSSLFGVVDDPELRDILQVQPVSICYPASLDGVPLTGPLRGLYAWFGDATMVPHFFRALAAEGARVEVRFHPPIAVTEETDRKQLAEQVHAAVRDGVAVSHGRTPTLPSDPSDASTNQPKIEAA